MLVSLIAIPTHGKEILERQEIDNRTKEHTQPGLSACPPKATWELVDSDKRIACTSSNGHLCRKIKH